MRRRMCGGVCGVGGVDVVRRNGTGAVWCGMSGMVMHCKSWPLIDHDLPVLRVSLTNNCQTGAGREPGGVQGLLPEEVQRAAAGVVLVTGHVCAAGAVPQVSEIEFMIAVK